MKDELYTMLMPLITACRFLADKGAPVISSRLKNASDNASTDVWPAARASAAFLKTPGRAADICHLLRVCQEQQWHQLGGRQRWGGGTDKDTSKQARLLSV